MDQHLTIVQTLAQATFTVSFFAFGAGAFFFYDEKERVHPRYRIALLLSAVICGIACATYYYMRTMYMPGHSFPTQFRYFDWILTTPLMLLKFTSLLNFKNRGFAMARLVFWDLVMIISGFLGETMGFAVGGFQMRWVMLVVGLGGWVGVLMYLYTGIRHQADAQDTETRRCIRLLTGMFTVGWLIYPIGYAVRAINPEYSDICQVVYNIGDIINKVGFGLIAWSAGTEALKGSTNNQVPAAKKTTMPAAAQTVG